MGPVCTRHHHPLWLQTFTPSLGPSSSREPSWIRGSQVSRLPGPVTYSQRDYEPPKAYGAQRQVPGCHQGGVGPPEPRGGGRPQHVLQPPYAPNSLGSSLVHASVPAPQALTASATRKGNDLLGDIVVTELGLCLSPSTQARLSPHQTLPRLTLSLGPAQGRLWPCPCGSGGCTPVRPSFLLPSKTPQGAPETRLDVPAPGHGTGWLVGAGG